MQFGIFGSAQASTADLGPETGQGFRDYLDMAVEAEALGYRSSFLVEHHFTGWNQVSATLMLQTALAMRTTKLRLGTAVIVLPWHNPVLLAEQAATLDLLSGGRLDFGIGKGYRHNEFAGFCIPMEEADERFEEGLAVILKAWTSEERFSHHGKHWHFEDVVVEPPSHQKPHPPIWMGAGSPGSIAKVAERGFKLLLDQYAPVAAVIERFNFFKSEVEKRGRKFDPNDVALSRGFYVAKNEADKAQAIETRLANQRRTAGLAQSPDKSNKATLLSYADTAEASADAALYGSPDEIARKLELLRKAGFEQILLSGPAGSRENLRAFARDVMPVFAGSASERTISRGKPALVTP